MEEVAGNGGIGAVVPAQTALLDEDSDEEDLMTPSEVKMKPFCKRIDDLIELEKACPGVKDELKGKVAGIFKEGKLPFMKSFRLMLMGVSFLFVCLQCDAALAAAEGAGDLEAFQSYLPPSSSSWGANITMNRVLKKGLELKMWPKQLGWSTLNSPVKTQVWKKIASLYTAREPGSTCPKLNDMLAAFVPIVKVYLTLIIVCAHSFPCNIISLCFIQQPPRAGSLGGAGGADGPATTTPRGNAVDSLAVVALAIADPAFMAELVKVNTGTAPEERAGFLTEGAVQTKEQSMDNLAEWLQEKRDFGEYGVNPLDPFLWPDLVSIDPGAAGKISGAELKTCLRQACSHTETVKSNFSASGYGTSGKEAYFETFQKMAAESNEELDSDYSDLDGLDGRDHSQASLT